MSTRRRWSGAAWRRRGGGGWGRRGGYSEEEAASGGAEEEGDGIAKGMGSFLFSFEGKKKRGQPLEIVDFTDLSTYAT
jgi:hypothetical protein